MNHRKILKIWWILFVCGISLSWIAEPLFAQEPAETRKWIGWGQAFGNYTQDDITQTEDVEGYTGEIMLSHRIFDDSMALGKAIMNSYFPSGFEDSFGIFTISKLMSITTTTPLVWANHLKFTTNFKWERQPTW